MATAALASASNDGAARVRLVATIFVGSFLLFLVQPMIARMALPRLGGAPAVWNSAMLVYQALLLAGYAYAHWLGRFAPARQAAVHLMIFLVAAATLPIGLIAAVPPPDANPFLWTPWLLLASIGPLFFVVSAQAPLIQRWYSLTVGGDPYPLYAASNLGSFAGLLVYPLLVEPLLPIAQQRWLWSGAYVVLALLVAWCALGLPRSPASQAPTDASESPGWRPLLMWTMLAAVPSGLILSTTLHLTTDVVAMPLLWVLPLGVYLLSFTVAFAANRAIAETINRLAPLVLLMAICGMILEFKGLDLLLTGVAVVNLFTLSVALHSRLFENRPEPRHLTLFYLAMSVGGMLGGVFCGLVAPLVFDWTYEHLLLLVAAAALMVTPSPFLRIENLWNKGDQARKLTMAGMAVVALLAIVLLALPESRTLGFAAFAGLLASAVFAIGNRRLFAVSVAAIILTGIAWDRLVLSASPGKMTRSFFGIYAIEDVGGQARMLKHGTTMHGVQNLGSPERQRMPTTYYAPESGVGLALAAAPRLFGDHARIGVVGLGTGTLACYAHPGQSWAFYEIDPVVAAIARDPKRFTFLSDCLPNAPIILGDARLSLDNASPAAADLLVIDAFSSDSIPMHLLTGEAFASYRRHLSDRGLLMVHISNRHLDLQPVLAAAASAGGWYALVRHYDPGSQWATDSYTRSIWVALSPNERTLRDMMSSNADAWTPLNRNRGTVAWTDDYASLLPLIRWGS